MKDREFLLWVADRLVLVHNEREGTDFIHRLVSIAKATDPVKETPNTESYEGPYS